MDARAMFRPALILLLFCTAACVRRDGRNDDCRWPGGARGALSADAEFAEDLAIRYADVHHGLRTPHYVSGEAYDAERDRCMATLFAEVAKTHGVPAASVASALGKNRTGIDIATILPFALLYGLAAIALARISWRRYPPDEDGWVAGIVMLAFGSLVLAAGATLIGEIWCWIVETARVGNNHMSYRLNRLWWPRHRAVVFAVAAIVYWIAGARAAATSPRPSNLDGRFQGP
jgi:hypothetical protein